jgi:SAM-dependent methyltransferase
MGDVADFYDEFSSYELEYLVHPNRRLRRVHEHLRRLLPRAPASALDIGCGIGITAAWLAKRIPHVIGVDISPQSVAIARSLHSAPEFLVAAPPEDPLPSGPYDLITLVDVVEHFPQGELSRLFVRIAEVAKPEAVVAINAPSKLFALRGESRQIIDEAIGVDEIVAAAGGVGMEPLIVSRYGAEAANQYVFCAFSKSYDVSSSLPTGLRDRLKDRAWLARNRFRRASSAPSSAR